MKALNPDKSGQAPTCRENKEQRTKNKKGKDGWKALCSMPHASDQEQRTTNKEQKKEGGWAADS